ncbi:MAG: efflux RND transporter periplasmic adaptor subunit [Pirellulales bacterium]
MKSRFVFTACLCAVTLFSPGRATAVSFDAFTEPYRKIEVAAAETGTVEKLLVREGDRVVKGQTLATLDVDVLLVSQKIATANTQARGKLNSAQAERDLRKTRLERLEPLRQQGHASQAEIDRARTELAVAEANLLSAREQQLLDELECKRIEAMIERRAVRSPIDGVVAKLHKDEREFVSNSSATVATVVQLDPLRVVFTVPTAYAMSIKVGQVVALEFPEGGNKARGKIELVAPVTEAESGTVRVKVLVDNPQGLYRCGVRCSLDIEEVPRDRKPQKAMTARSPQRE